jgi:hypothetical protein
MSFEGYTMRLCQHGHALEEGYDYSGSDSTPKCEVCGAPWVWCYTVNETNDSGVAPVLEIYQRDLGDDLEADMRDIYYLPVPAEAFRLAHDYSGLDETSPPVKPVQWQDLDHPDDGPFATERAAWDNKTKRYNMRVKKAKHERWKNRP